MDLVRTDVGTLNPFHLDSGIVEHVALSDQFLGSGRIENDGRIYPGDHPEGDSGREVGLDQAGDHIGRRSLGREYHMDSCRPSLLGETDDGSGDAPGGVLRVA